MRRLVPITLGLMLMLVGAPAEQAFALGLGGYISGGGGSADWTYDLYSASDFDADGDTGRAGLGFVMEVHPTGRHILNYRLGVGLETFESDFDFEFGGTDKLKLVGVTTDHTLGFAILRHDIARLWIGPHVRIGSYGGRFDHRPGDFVTAEFGVGGAFGANFHIGDRFTISTVAGSRVSSYRAAEYVKDKTEDEISGKGGTVFFNLVFMARTGDDAK